MPAHPSAAENARANAALAGRPAVVTVRDGDNLDERDVVAARFDDDGDLAVGTPHVVDSPVPAWGHTVRWTSVLREDVVEVSTVDRERGALKGLVAGAVVGFVTTTAWVDLTLLSEHGRCPVSGPCQPPSQDGMLLLGPLLGLGAALVTGGAGAVFGYLVGDGATVKISPEEPRAVARQ